MSETSNSAKLWAVVGDGSAPLNVLFDATNSPRDGGRPPTLPESFASATCKLRNFGAVPIVLGSGPFSPVLLASSTCSWESASKRHASSAPPTAVSLNANCARPSAASVHTGDSDVVVASVDAFTGPPSVPETPVWVTKMSVHGALGDWPVTFALVSAKIPNATSKLPVSFLLYDSDNLCSVGTPRRISASPSTPHSRPIPLKSNVTRFPSTSHALPLNWQKLKYPVALDGTGASGAGATAPGCASGPGTGASGAGATAAPVSGPGAKGAWAAAGSGPGAAAAACITFLLPAPGAGPGTTPVAFAFAFALAFESRLLHPVHPPAPQHASYTAAIAPPCPASSSPPAATATSKSYHTGPALYRSTSTTHAIFPAFPPPTVNTPPACPNTTSCRPPT